MKIVKIVSVFVILVCCLYFIFHDIYSQYDIFVQDRLIDDVFSIDSDDYFGYIYIPRFNVKRLIKYGTGADILDALYVGVYGDTRDLSIDDLIVLAGHNVDNVFSCLHSISIGDDVFLRNSYVDRKFVVYDKKVVRDDDFSYFYNRFHELMLITCDKDGYRLLIFLREVL